jgi:hypothetical protein
MFERILLLVVLALGPIVPASAALWNLHDEYGYWMGAFDLDFSASTASNIAIFGQLGSYTKPSFLFLGSPDHVGSETVHDYITFFSTESGNVYRTDYGGGEYHEVRVNESAIQIGTTAAPLDPRGGEFAVIINEIYNYDEIYQICNYYEEYYDESTGEFLGTGPCGSFSGETSYNLDAGTSYYGTLSSPVTVPLPPAFAFIVGAVATLAPWIRRGKLCLTR